MRLKKLVLIVLTLLSFNSLAFAKSGYGLNDKKLISFCVKEVQDRSKEGLDNVDIDDVQAVLLGWNPGYWLGLGIRKWTGMPSKDEIKASQDRLAVARCGKTTRLPIISSETVKTCNAQGTTLKGDYCISGIPKKPEEFLKSGYDVPATFVKSFQEVPSEQEYISQLGPQGKDIAAFTAEAQNIWTDLLACYEQNPQNARAAFVRPASEIPCKDVADKIALLKTNFYNALLQNPSVPFSIYLHDDNRLQFSYFAEIGELSSQDLDGMGKYALYTDMVATHNRQSRQIALAIHPLISQMALQIMVKFFKYAGPNDFFKLASKYKIPNQQYLNLFNNSLKILEKVNSQPSTPMGLWPQAGWAVWNSMNERLLLFSQKLDSFKDDSNFGKSKSRQKIHFQMFYYRYITNFGVVTSNFLQMNLPPIYFDESDKLINQYFEMDDPYQNINIAN